MKKILIIAISICTFTPLFSQRLTKSEISTLREKEDSLKPLSWQMIQGASITERFGADSMLTRILVRALSVRNSFFYPFDSLQTISKIYPPDSSFRIFTWQLVINENMVRQHGAIQMNTKDGSLKLFPLVDRSDMIKNEKDTITDNLGWVGAIYYKILERKNGKKTYYTLLGFDENNIRSTKKLVEILHFEDGHPVFGAPIFRLSPDQSASMPSRYIMEFKKDANPRLTYDPDMDMIIIEHLVSESNEPHKKWTLIPDGDYDALKWKNGKWVFVKKIFNEVTPEGKPPVPQPMEESKLKIPPPH